jgi:hypothetical protein
MGITPVPRRRKKAHELTTEEVLKRVFHPKVRKHLKKAAAADLGRGRKPKQNQKVQKP